MIDLGMFHSSSVTNYRVDVMIWNKNVQWGYLTVKLHNGSEEAVANIDQ